MKLITKAGIPRAQAHAAIRAMRPVYDPRSIMPGQRVNLISSQDGKQPADVTLQSLDLSPSYARKVLIERDGGDGFTATERKAKLDSRLVRVKGVIKSSLYRAGAKAVSREELLTEGWGYNAGVTTHTLETHIYRLRQKIEPEPGQARLLLTDAGGYRLQP